MLLIKKALKEVRNVLNSDTTEIDNKISSVESELNNYTALVLNKNELETQIEELENKKNTLLHILSHYF